jgi:hypothetical protein
LPGRAATSPFELTNVCASLARRGSTRRRPRLFFVRSLPGPPVDVPAALQASDRWQAHAMMAAGRVYISVPVRNTGEGLAFVRSATVRWLQREESGEPATGIVPPGETTPHHLSNPNQLRGRRSHVPRASRLWLILRRSAICRSRRQGMVFALGPAQACRHGYVVRKTGLRQGVGSSGRTSGWDGGYVRESG